MNPLPSPDLPPPVDPPASKLAIWSLILGLLGFVLCVPALGGLICGIVALVQISQSRGRLRGNGFAIAGIAFSVISPVFVSILAAVVIPVIAKTRTDAKKTPEPTLSEARRTFVTRLTSKQKPGEPAPRPPVGELRLVTYPSPVGKLPAYLSPVPDDHQMHPAIIWLTGGFSNGISEAAWTPFPEENDQSASIFRRSGVVTLYPSLRGGNDNPGVRETFYGEVDDVLAAAEFLSRQPGINPDRIYLGGHSTGGTLALLVAECSPRFRAIFALGPVAKVLGYGDESMTFDTTKYQEHHLRDPIAWLPSIRSATYVFEGDTSPSNISSLRELKAAKPNRQVHFFPITGKTHFSIIVPVTREIARQILADTAPEPSFDFRGVK